MSAWILDSELLTCIFNYNGYYSSLTLSAWFLECKLSTCLNCNA